MAAAAVVGALGLIAPVYSSFSHCASSSSLRVSSSSVSTISSSTLRSLSGWNRSTRLVSCPCCSQPCALSLSHTLLSSSLRRSRTGEGRPFAAKRERNVIGLTTLIVRGREGKIGGSSRGLRLIAMAAEPHVGQSGSEIAEFANVDNRRFLHVVYRVGDLQKTVKFYTECLGMKVLRERDMPNDKYTNVFLGYGPETTNFVVELTYNYGVESYDLGEGFGHFGISVEDVYKTVELVKEKGGKVTREPGPVKGGKTVIAFVEDPTGYKFELIQRPKSPEPLCQVMLRVGDLDRAIAYYENAMDMKLLRKRDNPEYKYTIAMMGYGPEESNAVLELTYNYGVTSYTKGNAYAQIALGTDDVYKTAEAVRAAGGKITREPGPLPGINTKIFACLDLDGWKTVFVDNADFLNELN